MAIEHRPNPQRPSLWTLALPVIGIVAVVFVVVALFKTILWFAEVGVVLILLVGFGVVIGRMSSRRR